MSLVERGRIGDALAAVLTGKGIKHQMGWEDEPLRYRSRSPQSEELIHQGFINAAAKPGEAPWYRPLRVHIEPQPVMLDN